MIYSFEFSANLPMENFEIKSKRVAERETESFKNLSRSFPSIFYNSTKLCNVPVINFALLRLRSAISGKKSTWKFQNEIEIRRNRMAFITH